MVERDFVESPREIDAGLEYFVNLGPAHPFSPYLLIRAIEELKEQKEWLITSTGKSWDDLIRGGSNGSTTIKIENSSTEPPVTHPVVPQKFHYDGDFEEISRMDPEALDRIIPEGKISPPLRTFYISSGPFLPTPNGLTRGMYFGTEFDPKPVVLAGDQRKLHTIETSLLTPVPLDWSVLRASGTILPPHTTSPVEWRVQCTSKSKKYVIAPTLDTCIAEFAKSIDVPRITPSKDEISFWRTILSIPKELSDVCVDSPQDVPGIIAGYMKENFGYFCNRELGNVIRENADDLPIIASELKGGHCDLLAYTYASLARAFGVPAFVVHGFVTTPEGDSFNVACGHSKNIVYGSDGTCYSFDPTVHVRFDEKMHTIPSKEVKDFGRLYVKARSVQEKRDCLRGFVSSVQARKLKSSMRCRGLESLTSLLSADSADSADSVDGVSGSRKVPIISSVSMHDPPEKRLASLARIIFDFMDSTTRESSYDHYELLGASCPLIIRKQLQQFRADAYQLGFPATCLSDKYYPNGRVLDNLGGVLDEPEEGEIVIDTNIAYITGELRTLKDTKNLLKKLKTTRRPIDFHALPCYLSFIDAELPYKASLARKTKKSLVRDPSNFKELEASLSYISGIKRAFVDSAFRETFLKDVGMTPAELYQEAYTCIVGITIRERNDSASNVNNIKDQVANERASEVISGFSEGADPDKFRRVRPELSSNRLTDSDKTWAKVLQVYYTPPKDIARISHQFRALISSCDRSRMAKDADTSLDQSRPYTSGDDLRHLDWKALARTDRYWTRTVRPSSGTSSPLHVIIDDDHGLLSVIDYHVKILYFLYELKADAERTGRTVFVTSQYSSAYIKIDRRTDIKRVWSYLGTYLGHTKEAPVRSDLLTSSGKYPRNILYVSNNHLNCTAAQYLFRNSSLTTAYLLEDRYKLLPLVRDSWVRDGK